MGAKIINVSLGGSSADTAEEAAVDYAAAKGAIVVSTAGNLGNSTLRYPGLYSSVFCVGNTISADLRSLIATLDRRSILQRPETQY